MSGIRKFFRRRQTFLLYFVLPYILILFLPVLFGGIIYFKSLGIIESEIGRADDAILKQIQQSVDSKLRDIEQLAVKIELDPRIKGLLHVTNEDDPIYSYNKYWLRNEFKTYMLADEFISRFYIYLHQSDRILASNGVFSPEIYHDRYYKQDNIGEDRWRSLLLRPPSKSYSKVGDDIVFAKPLVPYASIDPEDAMGAIVFHLNMGDWDRKDTILIMNAEDRLMFSSDPGQYDKPIAYEQLNEREAVRLRYAGQDMVAYSIPSAVADWKYVSLVPHELFMHKASDIRKLTIVIFVFVLLMGGSLVYFFSRKNYRPIVQLLRVIGGKSGTVPASRTNEYKYIEETVSSIVAENAHMEKKVDQQQNALRDYFLIRLIQGKSSGHISAEDMTDSYKQHFKSDEFAVMLFHLEEMANGREEELIVFITKNIALDIVRQYHTGFVVEVEPFVVCLVNFHHTDNARQKKELLMIAEQAQRFIAGKFGVSCSISISSSHRSLDNIKAGYQEAIDAIEYKLLFGSESIIHCEDIRNRTREATSRDFFKSWEQQFSSYVKAGDFQGAKQLIRELVGHTIDRAHVPIDIVKCNMFGLINTVIATVSEYNLIVEKDFLNKLDPIGRLVSCRTLPQLEKEICEILDEIEAYVAYKNQVNANSLKDDAIALIEAQYGNPDLSVSMIADQLQVSLPYLSKFFKSQTGEGVLEYIQKVRMQKAREHMAQQDLSVKELAALVGYTNPGTFTRLFKKNAGVTPGKFKG